MIWLTRPLADSETLAERLEGMGIRSLISPVMRMIEHPLTVSEHMPNAVLITSKHALSALASMPTFSRSLPIFCISETLSKSLRALGFQTIIHGNGDIDSLLPLIRGQLTSPSHLLYLSGEDIHVDVGVLLQPHGVHVERQITYEAVATDNLSTDLVTAMRAQQVAGACFFSARSAALAIALMQRYGLSDYASQMEALCLSLNVAERAASLPWKAIHACAIPTQEAMHELIVSRRNPHVL